MVAGRSQPTEAAGRIILCGLLLFILTEDENEWPFAEEEFLNSLHCSVSIFSYGQHVKAGNFPWPKMCKTNAFRFQTRPKTEISQVGRESKQALREPFFSEKNPKNFFSTPHLLSQTFKFSQFSRYFFLRKSLSKYSPNIQRKVQITLLQTTVMKAK